MSFNPSISSNEEIKFIGSYDVNSAFIQLTPNYPSGNFGLVTNIAGVCANTFLSGNFLITKTSLFGSPTFADETYSLVSYPKESNDLPKIGSLIWSGVYREKITLEGTTAPSVQAFVVTGADGIYSDVSRVIIDFNNVVRVLYFIGPKST